MIFINSFGLASLMAYESYIASCVASSGERRTQSWISFFLMRLVLERQAEDIFAIPDHPAFQTLVPARLNLSHLGAAVAVLYPHSYVGGSRGQAILVRVVGRAGETKRTVLTDKEF